MLAQSQELFSGGRNLRPDDITWYYHIVLSGALLSLSMDVKPGVAPKEQQIRMRVHVTVGVNIFLPYILVLVLLLVTAVRIKHRRAISVFFARSR